MFFNYVNKIPFIKDLLLKVSRTSEADWGYFTEDQKMPGIVDPTKEVSNKGLVYPRAKIIGGCSTVNGMIYMQVFFFHVH